MPKKGNWIHANQGGYTPKSFSFCKGWGRVTSANKRNPVGSAKDREEMSLSARQALEPDLAMGIKYLQSGILPPDDKKARELIVLPQRANLPDRCGLFINDTRAS